MAASRALDPDVGLLPGLGCALATGRVRRGHVDVAMRVLARIPFSLLARADADGVTGAQQVDGFLTEQAHTFGPHILDRLARHLLTVLAPDGSDRYDRYDRYDPNAFTRRALSMSTDSTGMLVGRFQLDPASAAIVKTALAHYGAPNPAATARNENGQDVPVTDERDHPQRLADALTTICHLTMNTTTGNDTATATPDPGTTTRPETSTGADTGTGSGTPSNSGTATATGTDDVTMTGPGATPTGSTSSTDVVPSGPATGADTRRAGGSDADPATSAAAGPARPAPRAPTHVLVLTEVDPATATIGPAEDVATGPLTPGPLARLA